MKKSYILGNWKANKTMDEAKAWHTQYVANAPTVPESTTIIVCPAFHHLALFDQHTSVYELGAQDISPFENGAYTGEVTGLMMKDLIRYVMIGHSERRKHFGETDEIVAQKVKRANVSGIIPVVCVSDIEQVRRLKQYVPEFGASGLLLYEPLFAIGTGASDTPENANTTAEKIQNSIPSVPILYGGSVTAENVRGFMDQPHLSGVGVGGASLDAVKFSSLIHAAVSS